MNIKEYHLKITRNVMINYLQFCSFKKKKTSWQEIQRKERYIPGIVPKSSLYH